MEIDMPVNYAPTAVANRNLISREQEFALALARYMDSYREAQLGRRRLPRSSRSLIGLLALTERGAVGSRA
jgi:hypothetical protein